MSSWNSNSSLIMSVVFLVIVRSNMIDLAAGNYLAGLFVRVVVSVAVAIMI